MKNSVLLILLFLVTNQVAQSQCSPILANIYTVTIKGTKYEIIKEKLNY